MTKAAIIVQRYGPDIIGGAESHAKQIAERLVSDLHWQVDVITTAAKDYRTWANEYPEGVERLNGVTIRRFASALGRSPLFPLFDRLLKRYLPAFHRRRWLHPFIPLLEKTWLVLQGPFCPRLVRYIAANEKNYDRLVFFTYLYYPTVWGHKNATHKATLIPTAHDEFPFHFQTIRKMLNRVPLLLPNTPAEADLIKGKLEPSPRAPRMKIAGLGIDTDFFRPAAGPAKKGITYLGRIGHGKNVGLMVDWCHKHFPDIPINLAGKVESDFHLPKDGNIRVLGFVSEQEKVQLMQSSQCVVNPSGLESLSLLVLEAIACGVPVLVNAQCEVLDYYTKVCPSVFGFRGEEEFVAALRHILATDWTTPKNKAALEESRRWLENHYSWGAVIGAFKEGP